MRISGAAIFSLVLAGVAGYAIFASQAWALKAALFPLVMALPLLVLALVQLVLDLRQGPAAPAEPAGAISPAVANRRTVAVFAWMGGFVLLVLLIGFPLTVPVFVLCYLLSEADTGWARAVILTGGAWAFFHGLFERLLRFPFDTGLVQTWLGL